MPFTTHRFFQPKKNLILSAFLALGLGLSSVTESAAAGPTGFGLGIILGEPTGLTSQFNLGGDRAVNAGLAWSTHDWFQLYGDYIFKFPNFYSNLFKTSTRLQGVVGIGALLAFNDHDDHHHHRHNHDHDDLAFAIRIPLGGEYLLSTAPIAFFFEIVPGLQLIDETDMILQGGVGARYYF